MSWPNLHFRKEFCDLEANYVPVFMVNSWVSWPFIASTFQPCSPVFVSLVGNLYCPAYSSLAINVCWRNEWSQNRLCQKERADLVGSWWIELLCVQTTTWEVIGLWKWKAAFLCSRAFFFSCSELEQIKWDSSLESTSDTNPVTMLRLRRIESTCIFIWRLMFSFWEEIREWKKKSSPDYNLEVIIW